MTTLDTDGLRPAQVADRSPSLPRLQRTYSFPETDASKAAELAEPLWRYLSIKVPPGIDVGPLRQKEIVALMRERFTNYVYARLVIGACHALTRYRNSHAGLEDGDLPPESEDAVLEAAVRKVLELDNEDTRDIVSYLTPLCARILSKKKAKPSATQAKLIRRYAVAEGHRCYMCGRELHYEGERPYPAIPEGMHEDGIKRLEAIRAKSAFEIEHIWSQARGGSRHRTNLAASCNECNKIKAHLMSFADLPIEQMISEATSDDSLAAAFDSRARFALLAKQDAKCAHCGIKFHSVEDQELYAVKKEWDEPYHFFNISLVCPVCQKQHYHSRQRADERGINLRAQKG